MRLSRPPRPGRSRGLAWLVASAVLATVTLVPAATPTAVAAGDQVVDVVGDPAGGDLEQRSVGCGAGAEIGAATTRPVDFVSTARPEFSGFSGRRAVGYRPAAPGAATGALATFTDLDFLRNLTVVQQTFAAEGAIDGVAVVSYFSAGVQVTGVSSISDDVGTLRATNAATQTFTWTARDQEGPYGLGTYTIAGYLDAHHASGPVSEGRIGFAWGCNGRPTYFDDFVLASGVNRTTYRFDGFRRALSVAHSSSYCATSARGFAPSESFVTTLSTPGQGPGPVDVRVGAPGYGPSSQFVRPGRQRLLLPVRRTGPVTFTAPGSASTDALSARAYVYKHAAIAIRRVGPAKLALGKRLQLSGRVAPAGRQSVRVLLSTPRTARRWRPFRMVRTVRTDARGAFRVFVRAPSVGTYVLGAMTADSRTLTSTVAGYGAVYTVVRKPKPQPAPSPTPPPSPPTPTPSPTPTPAPAPTPGPGGGHRTAVDTAPRAGAIRCGWRPAGRPGATAFASVTRSAAAAGRVPADDRWTEAQPKS